MKINSINPIKISPVKNRFQCAQKNCLKPVKHDEFIRTSNLSFKSGKTFDDLYLSNRNQIVDYAIRSKNPSLSGIKDILSSISGDVNVYQIQKMDLPKDIRSGVRAYYDMGFTINSFGPYKFINNIKKEIYVAIPKSQQYSQRIGFAHDLLHESIHFMQDEASDRESRIDIYSNYLNLPSKDDILMDMISVIHTLAVSTSILVDKFINNILYSRVNLPHGLQDRYFENVLSMYTKQIKSEFKKFYSDFFKDKDCFAIFEDFFFNYLKRVISDEAEAYKKANLYLFEKFNLDDNGIEAEKLRARFFEHTIEAVNDLISEQKDLW